VHSALKRKHFVLTFLVTREELNEGIKPDGDSRGRKLLVSPILAIHPSYGD